MTVTDPSTCGFDNTPGSILRYHQALAELLQGIQLSEEHAAEIIVAVRKITTDTKSTQRADICASPPPADRRQLEQVPPVPDQSEVVPKVPTSTSMATTAWTLGEVPLVPDQSKVVPKAPSGHYIVAYKDTCFVLPSEGKDAPFYLITKGRMVGVFSNWENAKPMVDHVSGATYRRLQSGTLISQGRQMVVTAIDNGVVRVVGKMPLATVFL
ncbi:hypothetical protein EV363DRAFT_1446614 [Boletus edulis]|nr:hypothetical protein EV363DRAFT_1446614 [Boletus edulis]